MTSTLINRPARPAALDGPADHVAGGPESGAGAGAACPIALRALRTGARTLADALAGIALDAPCDRLRQRAIVAFARLVLDGVRGGAAGTVADDVDAAADRVRDALTTFAHDVSAGAPSLAMACATLADRLGRPATAAPVHDHGARCPLLECRRSRRAAGPARAVVPWFLDAATPAERMVLVRDASPRVRWALRLGEDRYLRTTALVRG